MLKIVLDTNLLIDGSSDYFNFANRIIDLVLSGQVEAFANRSTLRENKLLVHEKITDEGYLKKLEYFFDVVKPVETRKQLRVVDEDSQDNKILESAVDCGADFLITSDHHLLKLENFRGVKIVHPAEFWSRHEDEGEGWLKWVRNFVK